MSQQIAVEAMEEISSIVQRKVTIWDNLHANDYDQTRLYLGPYSGRDARIIEHTRGVLTNPNCEFEVNFVALHTLAQWSIDRNTRFSLSACREFDTLHAFENFHEASFINLDFYYAYSFISLHDFEVKQCK